MKFFNSNDIFDENDFFIFLSKSHRLLPFQIKLDVKLEDILCVEEQKNILFQNTKSFIQDKSSHNILLWGARGMGKSTLIKCVIKSINSSVKKKIKMVEFLNNSLDYLPDVIFDLSRINKKFIVFIDDIAFNNAEKDFKLFKSLIEGSLLSNIDNVKYYITSNLRHLSLKEKSNFSDDDLSKKEMLSNVISLSDRFGCWLGFHENNQENYIKIINHYLKKFSQNHNEKTIKKAIQWSLAKGNFSGRTAYQFIQKLIVENTK
tara:strand:- start:252 stop:1034 length:783 start_codon:yes stop_codon:yes gene_type:complete